MNFRLFCAFALVNLILIESVYGDIPVAIYSFKRYPYKKKQKHERAFRAHVNRCEREGFCLGLPDLEYTKCIRTCINNDCFQEIYGQDELELGEIDVRVPSFKGCVLEKNKNAPK